MRQLKHHEKKLLKKVDFLRWKTDDNVRETQVSLQQNKIIIQVRTHAYEAITLTVVNALRSCVFLYSLVEYNCSNAPCVCALRGLFQVMRTYHIQNRDDYKKYNKVVGMITKLTSLLKQLDPKDTARIELTDNLLEK